MKRFSIPILSLLLCSMLSACGLVDPIRPVANGFHHALPGDHARLVVWGNHPRAVGAATTWLLKRGYIVVERAKLEVILHEQKITLTHTHADTANLLQAGKLLGANQVVFLDTNFSQQQVDDTYVNASGGKPGSYALYNINVSIRGIDIESGEIQWTGTATYPNGIGNPDEGMGHLTRSALAKAWG